MKKIFMIGKFNAVFEDINHYLGDYFNVQVCVDNSDMVKNMMKLNPPDLVLISLIGLSQESSKVFGELKFNYPRTPVICVGTESEQSDFEEYFRLQQFHALTRPVTNSKILEIICELLKLNFDGEKVIDADEKSQRKTILLVDDNAIQLRTLNDILREKYNVQMATSGMKALTLIGRKKPDAIFLDYEMPMCDGKMTLQMIREIEEAKDIPVVFLTGVREKEHIHAVLALRPAGYLLKPASTEKIFETLNSIFEEEKE